MKTVLLPIRVPSGIFCWDYGDYEICENFINEGGHNRCLLSLGELVKSRFGVVKCKTCQNLGSEETYRQA